MKNSIKFYNSVLKNLKKKTTFYKYFNKKYNYLEFNNYFLYYYNYFNKKNIKNKNIYVFPDKSFEMYCVILSILLSGNIFIPVNTKINKSGFDEMLKQSKLDLFVHGENDYNILNKLKISKTRMLCLKHYKKNFFTNKNFSNSKINIKKINFNSTAMIYFTSGSTGKPKGIKISHENICSDVIDQNYHLFKNNKKLVFGDFHETAFSIFFDIYFPAILIGGTISPAKKIHEIFFPEQHILKNKINCLITVPSTIQRIKETNIKEKIKLNILIVTGEPFYLTTLDYIYKKFSSNKIFNCYGGTEMSNWVFFHKCQKGDIVKFKRYGLVPIGKKFKSVKFKIKHGKLIICGPMVSKGYMDKKLNKNRFNLNKNEFITGDRAITYKKKIVCLGRSDRQVKIRGYRIELGEVETKIRQFRFVNEAIVFEKKISNYKNYLVSVISISKKLSHLKIRKKIEENMNYYMVPKKIIVVKKMPRNKNGKIDRNLIKKNFAT